MSYLRLWTVEHAAELLVHQRPAEVIWDCDGAGRLLELARHNGMIVRGPYVLEQQSEVTENTPGLVSGAHGETSREAALKVRPRTGTQRARILGVIESWGAYGATRDELATALGMTPNSVRPRVRELLQGGHIYVSQNRQRRAVAGGAAEVLISTRCPEG